MKNAFLEVEIQEKPKELKLKTFRKVTQRQKTQRGTFDAARVYKKKRLLVLGIIELTPDCLGSAHPNYWRRKQTVQKRTLHLHSVV